MIMYCMLDIHQVYYISRVCVIRRPNTLYTLYYLRMMINSDQNTSSSLQIVQPENRITFSNNDSSRIDLTYDKQLSYSKEDQPSFSFHIQEQGRVSLKQSYGQILLNNQPPKRKRKQIFDKYKIQTDQNGNEDQNFRQISLNISGQNDIMRAFDQIFSISSTPRNISNQYRQPNGPSSPKNIFTRKSYTQKIQEKIKYQNDKQQPIRFNTVSTPERKYNINPNVNTKAVDILMRPSDQNLSQQKLGVHLLKSQQFFKTPLDLSLQKKNINPTSNLIIKNNVMVDNFYRDQNQNQDQILNISEIQNRVSFIYAPNNNSDYSRDSTDINQILKAQIFQEKGRQSSTRIPESYQSKSKSVTQSQIKLSKNQFRQQPAFTKKPPGVYQQKQFITNSLTRLDKKQFLNQQIKRSQQVQLKKNDQVHIKQQLNKSPQLTADQKSLNQQQDKMQLSRFSDVYQRIDMSQSIANSVVMKDSRLKIFQNNNFLGSPLQRNGSLGSLKSFNKSGSSGFIGILEQNTIINGLGSQKFIQSVAQQQRIPIFFRKISKLNSVIPNFLNPKTQPNLDEQNKKLQQLVMAFCQAIRFLSKILQKVKQKQIKRKQVTQSFAGGISLQKFKNSNWQICMDLQQVQQLTPKQNLYANRQFKSSRVEQALNNYRTIAQYHQGIIINLKDQRGIQKYFQIRKKFWSIQKNVLIISEDLYTHTMCLAFPKHFIEFKQVLQDDQIILSQNQIRHRKILLQKIKRLRSKNQELSMSQVGISVIEKLTNQIKFNSTNY